MFRTLAAEETTLKPLDEDVVKRLAYIRFLFQQGVQQAGQPEPLSSVAVLSFHDAVELFLVLAGERVGANVPERISFNEYWGKIEPAATTQGLNFSGRRNMDRLNRTRVNLKHHGIVPGSAATQQAKVDTTSFLTENAASLFGVNFDQLNMVNLVTQEFARKRLEQATSHAEEGRFEQGIGETTLAFEDLLDDYSDRKRIRYNATALTFGQRLPHWWSTDRRKIEEVVGRSFYEHVEALHKTVEDMQKGLRVMAVGLDYRRYARFSMITPRVSRTMDGSTHLYFPLDQYTRENYDFCEDS